MGKQEAVESWVDWCRENLPPDRHVSVIYSLGAPWEEIANLVQYWSRGVKGWIFEGLAGIQTADPADLFARFPAIHYYRLLLASDPYALNDEDDARRALAQARSELRTIAEFLKPEDCPCDWRTLKFEIMVAFFLKDWGRARDLFDRAEASGCLDRCVVQALRGQFHFLVAVEGGLEKDVFDDPVWEPRLFGSGDSEWNQSVWVLDELPLKSIDTLQEGSLFERGLARDHAIAQQVSDRRWHLRMAICDLENAIEGLVALSPAYRSIHARACFEMGDDYTPKASAQYRRLLDSTFFELWPGMRPAYYLFAARSARVAGQIVEAQSVLDKWLAEDRTNVEALKELASLQVQETRYDEAVATLDRIVDLAPGLGEDLATRIALTVGRLPARIDERRLQEILSSRPEIPRLVDRLCSTYWPPYGRLEEEAKGEWKQGVMLLNYFADTWESERLPFEVTAIEKFATTVEIELRALIFESFKRKVQQDRRLGEAVRTDLGNPRTDQFCGYLVSQGHLRLGDMSAILGRSLQPQVTDAIYGRFGLWLRETHPRISSVLDSLRAIPPPRNLASHYGKRSRPASEVHAVCKNVLEALLSSSGGMRGLSEKR